MTKSYKVRLIPTKEQERLLWLHVDAMRFVWNWGLAYNMERFSRGEKRLGKESLGKILTELRNNDPEYRWLKEASVSSVEMALIDLDNAYARFFRIQKTEPKYTDKKIKKFKRKNKKLTMLGNGSIRNYVCGALHQTRVGYSESGRCEAESKAIFIWGLSPFYIFCASAQGM